MARVWRGTAEGYPLPLDMEVKADSHWLDSTRSRVLPSFYERRARARVPSSQAAQLAEDLWQQSYSSSRSPEPDESTCLSSRALLSTASVSTASSFSSTSSVPSPSSVSSVSSTLLRRSFYRDGRRNQLRVTAATTGRGSKSSPGDENGAPELPEAAASPHAEGSAGVAEMDAAEDPYSAPQSQAVADKANATSESIQGDMSTECPEASVNLSDWIRLSSRQRWVDTLEDSDEETGVESASALEKGSLASGADLVPADASTMCSESLEARNVEVEEASAPQQIPLWRRPEPAVHRYSSFKGTKWPKQSGRQRGFQKGLR
mmetsp:Transcript_91623/g.163074  ORF Transcript_91623/g.163074 Transcript_91623/m.163074 type:complete len:319 (-) Transcript_91623:139-1095(-)